MRCLVFFAAVLTALPASGGVLADMQGEFNVLTEKAKPAVVNIQTMQERSYRALTPEYFFYGIPEEYAPVYRQRLSGVGSGFLISDDGYLLTNAHVVAEADALKVTRTLPDGRELSYTGRVLGLDPYLDLALVKIDAKEKLPFLALGDSDKVRAGDWSVAIGSPFGLQQTLTVGVISSVRQRIRIDDRVFKNMLQTDASINRGNSGGPLLNISGEVVGMNTAIFSPSGASAGVGFAIPSSEMKKSLERLKGGQEAAAPGWAGVALAGLDQVVVRNFGLPSQQGALVQSVVPDSPAAKAGLEDGDVIVSIDGNAVAGPEEAADYIGAMKAGDKPSFGIYRHGRQRVLTVALQARPSSLRMGQSVTKKGQPKKSATAQWEGVTVAEQEAELRVAGVEPSSPLAAYLERGDVIVSVNGKPVKSAAAFASAVKDASLEDGVLFDVLRNGAPMFVSVHRPK